MASTSETSWGLTTTQAGEWLGVTKGRVIRLVEEGKLRATRVGHFRVVDPASIEAYRDRRRAYLRVE